MKHFTQIFAFKNRMTADGKLPPAERRGYKNVFNALVRIVNEEGTATLWKVGKAPYPKPECFLLV